MSSVDAESLTGEKRKEKPFRLSFSFRAERLVVAPVNKYHPITGKCVMFRLTTSSEAAVKSQFPPNCCVNLE